MLLKRVYKSPEVFISHQNIHAGEKPFKYYKGVKTIYLKVSFANTQIIHSGEIPYKCDQ